MFLVIIAALAAVCGADKLEKVYLPPASAKTAGGGDSLQAPLFKSFEAGSSGLPSGGYTNEFQGVIVDAVNPSSRATGVEQTGLGGPRSSYGSTDSKVGDAAFGNLLSGNTNEVASTRIAPGFESFLTTDDNQSGKTIKQGLGYGVKSLGPATGVVDNGSYDAHRYNGAGDYSDGNKYSDGRPSAGNKDSVSGSFVDQYNQRIPGTPVGTQGSGKYSSQGSQFGTSGSFAASNSQVGYKPQFGASSGTKYGQQSGFNSQFNTESRFGGQTNKPGSYGSQFSFNKGSNAQGSLAKAPVGIPGFSSAFSSAVTSGPGSASAFAQSGPGNTFPTKQIFGSNTQGSDLDVNPATPSIATASASVIDSPLTTQSQYNSLSKSEASATVEPGLSSSFASAQNGAQSSAESVGQSTSEFLAPIGQSSFGAKPQEAVAPAFPASATATASVTPKPASFGQSQQTFGSFGSQSSSRPGQYSTGTGSGFGSQSQTNKEKPNQFTQGSSNFNQFSTGLSIKPTKVPATELTTPFEDNEKPSSGSTSFNTQTSNQFGTNQGTFGSTTKPQNSQFGSSNFQSSFSQGSSSQYNNNKFGSFQTKPTDATFGSTVKPSYTQEQGKDNSYYYNQPNKPFVTPTRPQGAQSNQFVSSQQGNKYSNIPGSSISTTQTGQYYNGVTQAAASAFPSVPSTAATQLGSKPGVVSQSSSQIGAGLSTEDGTVSPTQEYEGTIYEYNKPAEVLPTPSPAQEKPIPLTTGSGFGSQFSQASTQSGSQSSKPTNTFQQTQSSTTSFGSQSTGQLVQKPFGSSQSSGSFQQNQFGSSGSAFNQKPFASQITTSQQNKVTGFGSSSFSQGPTIQTSQSSPKPFGSSQASNTGYQQTQTGSSTTFGQKPQTTQGTSFTSNKYNQASQSNQFASKPFGSQTTGFQQSGTTKPFGSTQATSSFQQTQFGSSTGSQFGQQPSKPGSSFTTATVSKGQSQFGQTPFGASQTSGSTQFGSTSGSIQNPTETQGIVATFQENQVSSTASQFGQGPEISSQQNQFGSSNQQSQFGSTVGQKPASGSSFTIGTATQGGSNSQAVQTTQFGSKPFGSSGNAFQQNQYGSNFGQKPTSGSSFTIGTATQGQSVQTTQKPFGISQTGSTFQQSQFGSSVTGSKDQTVQTTQFGSKPFGSSGNAFQQNQYGSNFGQKPTSGSSFAIGTATQSQSVQTTQRPFGSSQTGSTFQQSQFGSSVTDSKGQTQFGSKPFGSSGNAFQQNQYGSNFGQKPTSGSSFTVGTATQGQSVQTTQKPFTGSQTSSTFQQSQFGSSVTDSKGQTQFVSKPFGSSGNAFQQNQYGSNFGQKPTSGSSFTIGTAAQGQSVQTTQKPFSSSQTGSAFQQSQFGSSVTDSKGQAVQTTQFGSKPFGSSGNAFQQNQYGSNFGQKPTSGSSFTIGTATQGQSVQTTQKPFGISQTGSTFQQSQFGSSVTGSKDQTVQTTQFGSKPFGSSGNAFQQNQYGSNFGQKPTSGSSFTIGTATQGQSVQTTQRPFGSSQTGSTFQQSQFGSSVTGSKGQTVQTSQFGSKPFGSSGSTYQQTQFGSSFGQKPTSGSSFTIGTATQGQSTQTTQKPFGTAQTGSNFNEYGSSFTGSKGQTVQTTQSGSKPFGSSGSTFQQSQYGSTFGQKPQSTGSSFSISTVSNNKKPVGFGFQQNQYGSAGSQVAQPVGGTQTTFGFEQKPFGSSQTNFPANQFGVSAGQSPQVTQGSTSSVISKEEAVQTTQFGQNTFGSQTTGSGSQNQFSSSTVSPVTTVQFGAPSETGSQGQTTGSVQNSQGSGFQQTQFGSGGSYFGQKPLTNKVQSVGTTFGTQKPFGSASQYGKKPQSSASAFASTTGSASQFGVQPFGGSQTNKGSQFSIVSQNQPLKPFGSTQGSSQSQFSSFDQKTQQTQGSFLASGSPAQTVQSSAQFGSTGDGYSYQKPASSFNSQFGGQTSRPTVDQKPQPTQASAFASTSQPNFGSQTYKPFGSVSTQRPSFQTTVKPVEFGVQTSDGPEYVSSSQPQFSGFPASSTTSFQPNPTSPTVGGSSPGSAFGQSQASSTGFGVQSAQSTAQTSQKFGQTFGTQGQAFGSKPVASATAQSSVGSGEQFGGPRDPPRFDDKTGYHY